MATITAERIPKRRRTMHAKETTYNRAIKASKKDGRLRFVSATAYGFNISLRRTPFQKVFWTNGAEWGYWEAGANSGETKGECHAN